MKKEEKHSTDLLQFYNDKVIERKARQMKILVLGGAGYIGSHTVYELIDAGEEVVIIDNLETGHIEAVHPQAKFYKGDLRDKDICRQCTRSGKRY